MSDPRRLRVCAIEAKLEMNTAVILSCDGAGEAGDLGVPSGDFGAGLLMLPVSVFVLEAEESDRLRPGLLAVEFCLSTPFTPATAAALLKTMFWVRIHLRISLSFSLESLPVKEKG